MAGLVPTIHASKVSKAWMPRDKGMTIQESTKVTVSMRLPSGSRMNAA
jgi:hypothetical protein